MAKPQIARKTTKMFANFMRQNLDQRDQLRFQREGTLFEDGGSERRRTLEMAIRRRETDRFTASLRKEID